MEHFLLDIGIVIVLSAVLSWVAFFTRQPIIIAYIVCGVIAGPWGLSLVKNIEFVNAVSRIGITLLLFLAGIVLHPQRLIGLFRKTMLVALGSSLLMLILTMVFALAWGFGVTESLFIGLALMFSSTILVVKLLPTTTLHQQHMGSVCIGILIIEDLIAVLLLMFLNRTQAGSLLQVLLVPIKGIGLIAFALLFEQFVLRKVMARIDEFHEVLYLSALAWCLGMALLAHLAGFGHEVGAFVAGVALARSPLSLFFSEGLKFLRDFFLVLFFFVLGARIDLLVMQKMIIPAAILGILFITVKPWVMKLLFKTTGEDAPFSKEAAWRLGQASEFSLIIAVFALEAGKVGQNASQLIQMATIITMIISSYIVVFRFPTPLGMRKQLKQD
jgi:Kef-type K+ transport system membrane component KefB